MKRTCIILCSIVLLNVVFCVLSSALAESLYVRPDGFTSGNHSGSNWNNAFNGFSNVRWGNGSGSLGAGDTLWVAGGAYRRLLIQASGTSNTQSGRIYIKRVLSTDITPTTAAGWNAMFDSQVIVAQINGAGGYSYWTIDGRIPYTGIFINDTSSTANGVELGTTGPCNYISILNLDIAGPAQDGTGYVDDIRALNFNLQTHGKGLYMGYCSLHNYPTLISGLGMSDMLIEHNKFSKNFNGNMSWHPNVWQVQGGNYVIVRYNEITQWQDEGIMMDFVGTGDSPNTYWYIYGNVWHDPFTTRSPRLMESQYVTNGPIYFYNNTVVNVPIGIRQHFTDPVSGYWASNCESKNNIFFNSAGLDGMGFATTGSIQDYNLSDLAIGDVHGVKNATSSIFADYANHNYLLRPSTAGAPTAINTGTALASVIAPADIASLLLSDGTVFGNTIYFDKDFNGALHGADGSWDIGAYEYNSNPTSVPQSTYQPTTFALFQNYPNPFNPTTAISYQLSVISNVSVKIFDMLGREIAVLVNERKPAGRYSVEWNTGHIASGVYFCRMTAAASDPHDKKVFDQTYKLSLLK